MTLPAARDLFADAQSFPSLFDGVSDTTAVEPDAVVHSLAEVPDLVRGWR